MMNTIYQEHRIFRRDGNSVVLYVCFEELISGKYAVQQVEFFNQGDGMARVTEINFNIFDLFLEESPRIRCDWFDSVAEAIGEHDRRFDEG